MGANRDPEVASKLNILELPLESPWMSVAALGAKYQHRADLLVAVVVVGLLTPSQD